MLGGQGHLSHWLRLPWAFGTFPQSIFTLLWQAVLRDGRCQVFTATQALSLGISCHAWDSCRWFQKRTNLTFSLFLKKQSFPKWAASLTLMISLLFIHMVRGTLQTPKGKALFKIRKHLRTKDQSYFFPVKVEFDYFHHERTWEHRPVPEWHIHLSST